MGLVLKNEAIDVLQAIDAEKGDAMSSSVDLVNGV